MKNKKLLTGISFQNSESILDILPFYAITDPNHNFFSFANRIILKT